MLRLVCDRHGEGSDALVSAEAGERRGWWLVSAGAGERRGW